MWTSRLSKIGIAGKLTPLKKRRKKKKQVEGFVGKGLRAEKRVILSRTVHGALGQ